MYTRNRAEQFLKPVPRAEYVRKPLVLRLLGNIQEKKIAELGCGNGYWMRLFAQQGAKCTGVERENNQIEIAKKMEKKHPLGIKYMQSEAQNTTIATESQDIVFLCYVLLEQPSKDQLKALFKEAWRILKKNGKLMILDMHPFDPFFAPSVKREKGFHYFKSGGRIVTQATFIDGTTMKFRDYHWTFEDYFRALHKAGFCVKELYEPRPTHEMIRKIPHLGKSKDIPRDVVIVAKKN